MKIEVNDYVRTEFGNIGKFYRPASESSDVYYIYINKDGNKISSRYDSIVKHSNNIIDLIECGDYVNGMKVCKINEPSLANDYKRIVYCNESEGLYEGIFTNDEIKSIVTKQQMEAIQYVVE